MKTLILAVLALSFSAPMAFAKSELSSRQIVKTYNALYPTLQLSVAKPAPETALLEELEFLGDSLNGEPGRAGGLVHLACCHVSCGGGCGKK